MTTPIRLSEKLRILLDDSTTTERQVHAFLKGHKDIVIGAFATSWNYTNAFSEVQLGADLSVDFLVLCANSGQWIVNLVELKSPSVALYSTTGEKSKALLLVERQIAQRIDWRRTNEQAFREVLAKLVSRDAAAQCSNASVHIKARSELRDPHTYIAMHSHCLIGRSSTLTERERDFRRTDDQSRAWGSPQVVTYDRLLHSAARGE
ncbi:MAG: Shedu anti-phage system protein SduA domain-containing protein [Verrucomicrobiota bacterium]